MTESVFAIRHIHFSTDKKARCRAMRSRLCNPLIFNAFAKGRLSACKRRPFSPRLTAFWKPICRQWGSSAKPFGWTCGSIRCDTLFHLQIQPGLRLDGVINRTICPSKRFADEPQIVFFHAPFYFTVFTFSPFYLFTFTSSPACMSRPDGCQCHTRKRFSARAVRGFPTRRRQAAALSPRARRARWGTPPRPGAAPRH